MSPFKRERMKWIKPSLLWMAYRCGWATKEGQEVVLAIEITRSGFEWALAHSSLSHFERGTYADHDEWKAAKAASPVRIQWDPERNLNLAPLEHRAIQIGLSGEAVPRYVDEWTVSITDVTDHMRAVHERVRAGDHDGARALVGDEPPYELTPELAARVGASA